jgi:hypothetical protein
VTLSIGKLTAGREDYYLGALTAADEYLDPAEIPGAWHGALAWRLGLHGTVTAEAFKAILHGHHPDTDAPLVANAERDGISTIDLICDLHSHSKLAINSYLASQIVAANATKRFERRSQHRPRLIRNRSTGNAGQAAVSGTRGPRTVEQN